MFKKYKFWLFMLFFVSMLNPSTSVGANSKSPAETVIPPSTGSAKEDLIDINSATKNQLMTLPGVDESHADKIIEGRPYKTKLELTQRKIIPGTIYKNIIYKIIVKEKK